MKAVLTNYNFTPEWVKDYDDYVIYDRSDSKEFLKDFPQERIVYEPNVGDADYSKLSWLVDNYHNLPDVFLWTKSNLFQFITPEEWDEVKNNTEFTPLLTKNHKTYSDEKGPVCYYSGDIYWERNNSWFLHAVPGKYVRSWNEWADNLNLPKPDYIPFAPGGSYILTRERVHRYGVDLYAKMRDALPYCQRPGEAHCAERSYYLLWA